VQASGADLEDVAISKAGSRSVVRVVVDRDGGLDLDAVGRAEPRRERRPRTRPKDVLKGSFVLEVTTPGVDRPLSEPRHWRRAEGPVW